MADRRRDCSEVVEIEEFLYNLDSDCESSSQSENSDTESKYHLVFYYSL